MKSPNQNHDQSSGQQQSPNKTSESVQAAAHAETDERALSDASAAKARDDETDRQMKDAAALASGPKGMEGPTLANLTARVAALEADLAHYRKTYGWAPRDQSAVTSPTPAAVGTTGDGTATAQAGTSAA